MPLASPARPAPRPVRAPIFPSYGLECVSPGHEGKISAGPVGVSFLFLRIFAQPGHVGSRCQGVSQLFFQIGAVRFGTDAAWTGVAPRRAWFVALPDEAWEIRSEALRDRHEAEAVVPATALLELHAYTADADVIVAYNGTDADFPLLAAAGAKLAIGHDHLARLAV